MRKFTLLGALVLSTLVLSSCARMTNPTTDEVDKFLKENGYNQDLYEIVGFD